MGLERRDLFSTPLFQVRHPRPAALNAALLRRIGRLQHTDPGLHRSNVKGWHSDDRFFALRDPAVQTLRRFLLDQFVAAYRQLAPDFSSARASLRLIGWANVLPRGGYNELHDHPRSTFSGCYYVQGTNKKAVDLAGTLELRDPRGSIHMSAPPGFPYDSRVILSPPPGTAIFFPSWLLHMVHPHEEPEDRVSIAFNLMFTGKRIA